VIPFRERDIRNLIGDLLDQTGAFDRVYLSGLPEDRGEPSGDSRSVAIEPWETTRADPWDDDGGDPLLTCRVHVVFLARHDDPRIRDEMVELLLNVAADALGGNSFGGAAIPARTQLRSWSWQKSKAPERRISAVLEYQYLGDGWTGFNTAE